MEENILHHPVGWRRLNASGDARTWAVMRHASRAHTSEAMTTDAKHDSTIRYEGALRWATEAVLGAFYRVSNELGTGFLESVYEAAMVVVLDSMGIRVERQAPVNVRFRGTLIGSFKIDLLVESAIAVELKAGRTLDSAHESQLLNYLRASDLEIGLLLNFGERPSFKRLAYSNRRKLRGQAGVGDVGRRNDADPTTA
jgi:GxxExxY protein